MGHAAQLKGDCAAAAIQASWQHRPFRNPIFLLTQQQLVLPAGTDTWRGWGLLGAGADGFDLHTDQLVQKDSGEMDSRSDSLPIVRIV